MPTDLVPLSAGDLMPPTYDREEFRQTATFLAREYATATVEIARLLAALKAQTERLDSAFAVDECAYSRFGLRLDYNGLRSLEPGDERDMGRLFTEMKRRAWRVLIDRLGIKNIMSVKKRAEFEEQLISGDLPEINEETMLGVLLGLAGQAEDFATEAAKEVFDILRPRSRWGKEYKTNDAFRVGRKVILTWKVEQRYVGGGFYLNHSDQEITAIDGIFHLLDGNGVMREHRGPLVQAIEASRDGRGETAYFRFRACKNRNLHLEFKRLDLVMRLNELASGERVLGNDPED